MGNSILLDIWIIVWSILGIILFFKIWGATNNIADIREMLAERLTPSHEATTDDKPTESQPEVLGPLVVDKSGRQYRIVREEGEMVVIRSSVTGEHRVHASEIKPFEPAPPQR